MKRILTLTAILVTSLLAQAQNDALAAYLAANPEALEMNIIHEGTTLRISADEDNLMLNIGVAHPALQMRMLMQRMTIYVDPTGKKRTKYAIQLPSAIDVKEQMEAMNPDADREHGANERPDIQPLMQALVDKGATYTTPEGKQVLDYQRFRIELNQQDEVINFYLLLPKDQLMQAKKLSSTWTVGIVARNDFDQMPPPDGAGPEQDMMAPPSGGGGQGDEDMREFMQREIRSWTPFSIDEANDVNADQPLRAFIENTAQGPRLKIISTELRTQLSFLMQGLNVDMPLLDSMRVSFPTAAMVRQKMQHHPNQVKPEFAQGDTARMVRPDVLPLLQALNDTTATVSSRSIAAQQTHDFSISVDRTTGVMTFEAQLPGEDIADVMSNLSYVGLLLTSSAAGMSAGQEYGGKSLSGEHRRHPQGFGEGLQAGDAERRRFSRQLIAVIK